MIIKAKELQPNSCHELAFICKSRRTSEYFVCCFAPMNIDVCLCVASCFEMILVQLLIKWQVQLIT